ncbi:MAG: MBL fold metallo-hydrolase [Ilumatobacter sp.]|uniref:MBL fold metallo-hydrolase n=1 Tax=Ilumatobacter sp. TaxID=1967498 RepID=UPI003919708F
MDFVDEGLGHSSYLIDLGDGSAAVIDPPRFPTAHETLASRDGLRLAWTADTHSHADYVTGSPGLTARLGATFVAPAASRLDSPHDAVTDGQRVELGNGCWLIPVATPGHTLDHHSYLLECDGALIGLFSGGSLMVGAVGRTDLAGPDLAEPLAHQMFRSLRRFDELPDDLAVYPTHGAGSFCSAPGSTERTTTMGRERATNPLLSIASEDEFVDRLLGGFGTFPSYFLRLPELNRRGPTVFDAVPTLDRLSVDTVAEHVADGALVIDARPMADFGAGHIPGSFANTLRPVFASWIGWLIDPGRPLIFVLNDDHDRADVVRQCLDVGHENLLGELDGGIDAWATAGRPVAAIGVVDAHAMAATVVDVRQRNEYVNGHVPAADNVELGAVADMSSPTGQVTVMCGHGERAMTAASILTAAGDRQNEVSVFDGGPDTWSDATGLDLEVGA